MLSSPTLSRTSQHSAVKRLPSSPPLSVWHPQVLSSTSPPRARVSKLMTPPSHGAIMALSPISDSPLQQSWSQSWSQSEHGKRSQSRASQLSQCGPHGKGSQFSPTHQQDTPRRLVFDQDLGAAHLLLPSKTRYSTSTAGTAGTTSTAGTAGTTSTANRLSAGSLPYLASEPHHNYKAPLAALTLSPATAGALSPGQLLPQVQQYSSSSGCGVGPMAVSSNALPLPVLPSIADLRDGTAAAGESSDSSSDSEDVLEWTLTEVDAQSRQAGGPKETAAFLDWLLSRDEQIEYCNRLTARLGASTKLQLLRMLWLEFGPTEDRHGSGGQRTRTGSPAVEIRARALAEILIPYRWGGWRAQSMQLLEIWEAVDPVHGQRGSVAKRRRALGSLRKWVQRTVPGPEFSGRVSRDAVLEWTRRLYLAIYSRVLRETVHAKNQLLVWLSEEMVPGCMYGSDVSLFHAWGWITALPDSPHASMSLITAPMSGQKWLDGLARSRVMAMPSVFGPLAGSLPPSAPYATLGVLELSPHIFPFLAKGPNRVYSLAQGAADLRRLADAAAARLDAKLRRPHRLHLDSSLPFFTASPRTRVHF